MATQTGIDASVKIGTTLVMDMATWSVTDTRAAITAPIFGEEFNKVHGMGIRNVTGTITGYLNQDDTNGQSTLFNIYASGGYVDDFRLYINDDDYFQGTKVFITSNDTNATAEDAVIPRTFNFTASENWTLITA